MSRGYIVLAQNNKTTDYLRQAYALALNLKLTQSKVSNLTVCVDEATKKLIKPKHRAVFDHIVDIPWGDAAKDNDWKIQNKWKFYHMSPYDETVILDADMLFPNDVSHWWDIMSERDVWATTDVLTYREELVYDNYYRKVFKANDLPNVYTAFFYFKKSKLAAELFDLIEIIFQHWQRMYHVHLINGKPDWVSGDVIYALAIKLLNIQHECTMPTVDVPTFVHMKPRIQNANIKLNWNNVLPTYYRSCSEFKIGNFKQQYPFHYVEDDWLTDEMILGMERELNEKV